MSLIVYNVNSVGHLWHSVIGFIMKPKLLKFAKSARFQLPDKLVMHSVGRKTTHLHKPKFGYQMLLRTILALAGSEFQNLYFRV